MFRLEGGSQGPWEGWSLKPQESEFVIELQDG